MPAATGSVAAERTIPSMSGRIAGESQSSRTSRAMRSPSSSGGPSRASGMTAAKSTGISIAATKSRCLVPK